MNVGADFGSNINPNRAVQAQSSGSVNFPTGYNQHEQRLRIISEGIGMSNAGVVKTDTQRDTVIATLLSQDLAWYSGSTLPDRVSSYKNISAETLMSDQFSANQVGQNSIDIKA